MLRAMDIELLEGATCAGSDLTARLLGELAHATARLHSVEQLMRNLRLTGARPPAAMRAEHLLCQRYVGSLRQMLAEMPDYEGGGHVATA